MSGKAKQFTDAYAKKKAREYDCDIDYSTDTVLQLDLDSDEDLVTFEMQFQMLRELGVVKAKKQIELRRSRSNNRHVIIDLEEPLPLVERILLQAVLGSDLKREMLCYAGMKKGQENPVLLFRPRPKKEDTE